MFFNPKGGEFSFLLKPSLRSSGGACSGRRSDDGSLRLHRYRDQTDFFSLESV